MNQFKKILVPFILLTGLNSFAQTDSTKYHVSLSIDPFYVCFEVPVVELNVRLSSRSAIEFSFEHRSGNHDNPEHKLIIFNTKDAFWFFNTYKIRLGYKYYFHKDFFICPMIGYGNHEYSGITFQAYEDYEGEMYDVDYTYSRQKNDLGLVCKLGLTKIFFRHIFTEGYIGAGMKCQKVDESLLNKTSFNGDQVPGEYPVNETFYRILPTVHLGFQVGLAL